VLLKVKSWRDAGETLCGINNQEEAKLQFPHLPIASPLHIKWRNQEAPAPPDASSYWLKRS
jgi:hypothetical protein